MYEPYPNIMPQDHPFAQNPVAFAREYFATLAAPHDHPDCAHARQVERYRASVVDPRLARYCLSPADFAAYDEAKKLVWSAELAAS